METFIAIVAVLFGLIGIVGSVMPALPGPPIAWVGLLMMYFRAGTNGVGETMSLTILFVMLAVTILVTILDYLFPIWGTKLSGGSKYAGWGATIGMLVGVFVPAVPAGMIGGALIGAFVAEYFFAKNSGATSIKSALYALLGFLCGTGFKLACCGVMLYYIIVYI